MAPCPCPLTACLPWLNHAPMKQADLEKGPREHGNQWEEESWKMSPGSGSSSSRQGEQQGAMPSCQAMPNCLGSGYVILCPRMSSRAEHTHAMLSCASPGCAKPCHAKLGPC